MGGLSTWWMTAPRDGLWVLGKDALMNRSGSCPLLGGHGPLQEHGGGLGHSPPNIGPQHSGRGRGSTGWKTRAKPSRPAVASLGCKRSCWSPPLGPTQLLTWKRAPASRAPARDGAAVLTMLRAAPREACWAGRLWVLVWEVWLLGSPALYRPPGWTAALRSDCRTFLTLGFHWGQRW